MAHNISGFGITVNVKASRTFPSGFDVTQFADDADPFDIADNTIGDAAMNLNGDLVAWSTAAPIDATLNVIPDSDDDKNLAALWTANRPSKGKTTANDEITLTRIYQDGSVVTLTGGVIVSGPPTTSAASAGRKKSKVYSFKFEAVSGG